MIIKLGNLRASVTWSIIAQIFVVYTTLVRLVAIIAQIIVDALEAFPTDASYVFVIVTYIAKCPMIHV